MIQGKTSTGFEYTVNENVVNDWRFTKAIAATAAKDDAQKVAGYIGLVTLILGDEGEERLCAHCTEEDGTIPSDRISSEVLEILTEIGKQQKKP